jgi:hypothetical protein
MLSETTSVASSIWVTTRMSMIPSAGLLAGMSPQASAGW